MAALWQALGCALLLPGWAAVFAWPVRRRPHTAVRLAALTAASLMLMAALWALGCLQGFRWWLLLVPVVFEWAAALVLCDQPLSGSVYQTAWTVMTMQFVFQLFDALYTFAAPRLGAWADVSGLFVLPFSALCAAPLYRFVIQVLPVQKSYRTGPRQTLSAVMLGAVFEVLSYTAIQGMNEPAVPDHWPLLMMCEFYCLTVLYLQSALFKKSAMSRELATLDLLWHQQREQYSLAKENIALINRKCHDMKHQIRALQDMADSEQRRKYLEEIDGSIRIYDSIVKTGSEVLDTILTEKSLRCHQQNIRINCVADGSRMGFLDPVDAYSIFGNAIDNAIEEVQKFDDVEKRQIDVLVHVRQRFLIVTITNPVAGAPVFRDGLPLTTKGNNGYHGFGLKSVRHTVEKYDGHLTVGVENGCFYFKILFPLPAGS